jgi:hypothetical protein
MQEQSFKIPVIEGHKSLLHYFAHFFHEHVSSGDIPLRFVISKTDNAFYHCETGSLSSSSLIAERNYESIFQFRKRKVQNTNAFNAILLIPTGIGSELGGHAGDAGPVARLIASNCDNLILHPNVVNASDINEMPENSLYVEGSVLSRLLLGTIGLQKIRSNRILMVMDNHKLDIFVNAAINSINAARATYGLDCPEIIKLEPSLKMSAAYSESGRAVGKIEGLENLFKLLDEYSGKFDAVALSSVIKVPHNYHMDYFLSEGEMINPWGGVEAMLTHAISHYFNIPSAHSPMFETEEIANIDPGVVDPRMAAEAVSLTFLQCILKGLQRSPKIISDRESILLSSILSVEDISCLIIPDGCIGLPTLAALEQGIPVIAVRGNKNRMENDLTILPWAENQLYRVDNYLEAVGVMAAIKSGVTIESIQRPLNKVLVSTKDLSGKSGEDGFRPNGISKNNLFPVPSPKI